MESKRTWWKEQRTIALLQYVISQLFTEAVFPWIVFKILKLFFPIKITASLFLVIHKRKYYKIASSFFCGLFVLIYLWNRFVDSNFFVCQYDLRCDCDKNFVIEWHNWSRFNKIQFFIWRTNSQLKLARDLFLNRWKLRNQQVQYLNSLWILLPAAVCIFLCSYKHS